MNRSAKGFRVISGIFVLLNLAAFFMPAAERVQENYPVLEWFQLDYIKNIIGGTSLYGKPSPVQNTSFMIQAGVIIFVVLPLLLSLIAGIWGIVGNYRQITSCILVFVVLALYVGMFVFVAAVWPETAAGQIYRRGSACIAHLILSACASVAAVIALFRTPGKKKAEQNAIPQVREIRQQQIEAKYSVLTGETSMENKPSKPEAKSEYVPGEPRGVLVGLTGLYAGAEIPMPDGEYIKLGRQADNHLVFTGQPNVSRNHCRIKWDAKKKRYFFYDFSSSGSFVNGSSDCLAQNLEMEMLPGTVVEIGDETNTFRLE